MTATLTDPSETLALATSGGSGALGLVHRISSQLGRVGRRGFLVGTAVAASALATRPKDYVLRPVAAYDTICGPGNTAASGWTVFCCTITGGRNTCPPGSFTAGWWKAADSSWCGGGYRYIVDCNAQCTGCSSGCSGDHICDTSCWNCSCGRGSSASCDQRRVCCNAFRYGQCNTQVKCSGGVHCRVVSCVPPYEFATCTTTSLRDDRTSEHSAPCLPQWDAIAQKYASLGEGRSFLGYSLGPVRTTSDAKATYVAYSGGHIYRTASRGAFALRKSVRDFWAATGVSNLGYPTSDLRTTTREGWVQTFERGCIADSPGNSVQAVFGASYSAWVKNGREGGALRYPVGPVVPKRLGGGWIQGFENGCTTGSPATSTQVVHGVRWTKWQESGREGGSLGYPTSQYYGDRPDGGWIQAFQTGCIVDSLSTSIQLVTGSRYTTWVANGRESGILRYPTGPYLGNLRDGGWIQLFQNGCVIAASAVGVRVVFGLRWQRYVAAGRESGVLGYPVADVVNRSRGNYQVFQGGELWLLGSSPARLVYGEVLRVWKEAGGADGDYGFPLTDTVASGSQLTCRFEGGTITA